MGLDKKPFKISALKATRFNNNQDEFNLESPKEKYELILINFLWKGLWSLQ